MCTLCSQLWSIKSGCVLFFCFLALSKDCQTFESKVSIHLDCFELSSPGFHLTRWLLLSFYSANSGQDLPSLYSKSSRCQDFPKWAFLWHNPISPKQRVMHSFQYTSPWRSPLARKRAWWQTFVDVPHVDFLSILEWYLISIGCLFPDLFLLPTWIETINFLQGLILVFTLTPFFPPI